MGINPFRLEVITDKEIVHFPTEDHRDLRSFDQEMRRLLQSSSPLPMMLTVSKVSLICEGSDDSFSRIETLDKIFFHYGGASTEPKPHAHVACGSIVLPAGTPIAFHSFSLDPRSLSEQYLLERLSDETSYTLHGSQNSRLQSGTTINESSRIVRIDLGKHVLQTHHSQFRDLSFVEKAVSFDFGDLWEFYLERDDLSPDRREHAYAFACARLVNEILWIAMEKDFTPQSEVPQYCGAVSNSGVALMSGTYPYSPEDIALMREGWSTRKDSYSPVGPSIIVKTRGLALGQAFVFPYSVDRQYVDDAAANVQNYAAIALERHPRERLPRPLLRA